MKKRTEETAYRQGLQQEKNRKNRLVILLGILLALLFILIVSIGLWFANTKIQENVYVEYMREADRYLTEMDYEAAELCYLRAIEEEPDETGAYTGLAAIYVTQRRLEEAKSILERGIHATNSEALFRTYEEVLLRLNEEAGVLAVGTEGQANAEELSAEVTVNDSVFEAAAKYTYSDYVQRCGNIVQKTTNPQGGCDLQFEGYRGILSFYNVEDDYFIYDEQAGMPRETKKPNEIRFKNLGAVFLNYQGAVSFSKLTELFGESIRIEQKEEGISWQVVIPYRSCTFYIECDSDGNVWGTPDNRLVPGIGEGENEEDEEEGSLVSGYVISALDGGSVTAKIRFLKGGQYGTPEKEVQTGFDGSFQTRLPEGHYMAEVSAAGYILAYEEIDVKSYADLTGLQFTISPGLQDGEIRIVLTWGASPRDLDSHLNGRNSAGNPVRVYFGDMKAGDSAELDLDDRMSYGPETTTIYDVAGSYTFSVHDFTNGDRSGSSALGSSGAVVKVYLADGTQYTYTVPAGNGTWWDVCRIENGQVVPINTLR